MRKLITILFVLFCLQSSAQVYQLMPQYGYQANRMVFDSTLQIPTTCGVPTLKSVQFTTRRAAIAFDSCNNRFYQYNPKTQAWSQVSGGGGSTDTTSLSNRIDERVKYTDTASMLSNYLTIADTTNQFVKSVTSINDSSIRVIKGTTTTDIASIYNSTNAKRLITNVYNNTGATIAKGSVVYISGRHSSNLPTIAKAQANNEDNSYKTFALVADDIADNSSGIIIQAGNITGLNLPTSSFTDGDIVYLSPTTAGGLTTTKPLSPFHICKIGSITRAHPTLGSIEIKIENGWQLDELSDVSIPLVPADSVLLQFSRVDSLWHDVTITNAIGTRYLKPSDTASLSSRINAKLSASDTISLSNRINAKFNTTDTSNLQQKSLPANSFMGNNTTSAANPTAQIFKQFGNQTYSDSIGFTGTLNPSGSINHSFRWSQVGNLVTLHITLTYANNGTISQVAMELPDGLPAPILPTGLTSNNEIICYGSGYMVSSTTGVATVFSKVFLRQNTGLTNDYEVVINQANNASYRIMNATIQYFAQ
jgi:hypothetical protein